MKSLDRLMLLAPALLALVDEVWDALADDGEVSDAELRRIGSRFAELVVETRKRHRTLVRILGG